MVAARKPFTTGESTCCDIRSGSQRPKCQSVTAGKKAALRHHGANVIAATRNGADRTRRWTRAGTGTTGRRSCAMIGQRYVNTETVATT